MNRSTWPTDGALTGTITLGLSGLESNGNERLFHTAKSSRTGDSIPDAYYKKC